jgi:hypothetical protein
MRTVGVRAEPTLTLHASGVALERVATFCESLSIFGVAKVAPKGLRRFKSHALANRDMEDGIARGMAANRSEG